MSSYKKGKMSHVQIFKSTHGFWHTIINYIFLRWMIRWRSRWPVLFSTINHYTVWFFMYSQHFIWHIPSRSMPWFSRLSWWNYFLCQQSFDKLCSLGMKSTFLSLLEVINSMSKFSKFKMSMWWWFTFCPFLFIFLQTFFSITISSLDTPSNGGVSLAYQCNSMDITYSFPLFTFISFAIQNG